MKTVEFLRLWFDDARVYVDDDLLTVEIDDRKFVVSLWALNEIAVDTSHDHSAKDPG